MVEVVRIPDLGGTDSVIVIEVSVAPGETVEAEQTLLVVESDKATMDIPCPTVGVVEKILVAEGDEVDEGDAIVELVIAGTASESCAAEPEIEPAPEQEPASAPVNEPAAPPSTGGSTVETVRIPDIGGESAAVVEVSVAPGDTIDVEQAMLVLESDKATMDVPSPVAGIVEKIMVNEGDDVSEGDIVLEVNTSGAAAAEAVPAAEEIKEEAKQEESTKQEPVSAKTSMPVSSSVPAPEKQAAAPVVVASGELLSAASYYAGPATRQLARELNVDLSRLKGSGPRKRILKEDLYAYLKDAVTRTQSGDSAAFAGAGIPSVPELDYSRFGEVETVSTTRIQQLTAQGMQRSWLNAPHVTHFDDADITDMDVLRKSLADEASERGTKLTPLPFLLKAAATALQGNPAFNRAISADGKQYIQRKYAHIGMAVDTPQGLVVPVIQDVDKKDIWQLSEDVMEMAGKARDGKLKPADMKGACFTISSLGAIGGNGFTPIVNTPEVGILGVSKSSIRPVWNGSEFEPKMLLPLSLSYDHRVVNGADAGKFMVSLIENLENPKQLLG